MREVGRPIQRIDVPAEVRRAGMSPALFRNNRMLREMGAQFLDDQFFAGTVCHSHQIVFALKLESHISACVIMQQSGSFASNFECSFEVRSQPLAHFVQILDVVFVKEQIRFAFTR